MISEHKLIFHVKSIHKPVDQIVGKSLLEPPFRTDSVVDTYGSM